MEFTNEEMVKSLTSLIDETLEEIEEIKKSKFAASEISLGDDKSGIADRSKNGKLEAKKAEDEDEEDEDEEDEDDMDKAEYGMDKADCMDKAEDEDEEEDEDEDEEKDEKMSKAMSSMKELKMPTKKELKIAKKPDAEGKRLAAKYGSKKMKKSEDAEEMEDSLMKSYVDEKVSSLEKAISRLTDLVESIADAPAPRKGVPAGVAPLHKSQEESEPLSKSQVANQLFELKKSGKQIDSADIFKVETGNNLTVLEIANKYGLR
jgi:hypothetical protein